MPNLDLKPKKMLLDIKRILVLFFGNAFWVVALKMVSFINFQSAFKLDNTASKGINFTAIISGRTVWPQPI